MLKKGDSGDEVEAMQNILNMLGYLTPITGIFDERTDENIRFFQFENSLKPDGIVGPLTETILVNKANEFPTEFYSSPVSLSDTPWMEWLMRNVGQEEIRGSRANPFIVDLFKYTTLSNHKLATTDETAWCSALACAALEKSGYKSTRSAAAISFDTYGEKSELKYGAIVTFSRDGGSGRHVSFYVDTDRDGNLKCIGGNQKNSLNISNYSKDRLIAIRWPIKKKMKDS